MKSVSHLPRSPIVTIRRLAKWYLSPSGILLAITIVLLGMAFVLGGITDARWTNWLGLAGMATLAIFLPYRFSRQQGQAHRGTRTLGYRLDSFENETLPQVTQKLRAVDGAVATNRAQLESGRANAAAHKTRLDRLEAIVAQNTTTLTSRQTDPTIGARLTAVEQRDTSHRIAYKADLDRVDVALNTVADRLDLLQNDVNAAQAAPAPAPAVVDEVGPQNTALIENLRLSLAAVTTRLDRVVAADTATGSKIDAADTELAAARHDLSAVQEELSTARSELAELTPVQRNLERDVETLVRREDLSGATTSAGFHLFARSISEEDLSELGEWANKLGLPITDKAISYIAHDIRRTEDALVGRMAGSLASAVLRSLVLRSVKSESLHVVEIGSLFGISIAAMETSMFGFIPDRRYTAIDPLDGYYNANNSDVLTGLPISREVFDENMRRARIEPDRISVIQRLSTDTDAIEAISPGSADVLFIDGDHTGYGVEFDFKRYRQAVSTGGFIIFDDYQSKSWPDVQTFVDEKVRPDDELHFVGSGWETAVFRVL